jgi:hypothetical protein
MEEIFWRWVVERWRYSSGHFCSLKEVSSGQMTAEGQGLPPRTAGPLLSTRLIAEPAIRKSQRFFDGEQAKTVEPDR